MTQVVSPPVQGQSSEPASRWELPDPVAPPDSGEVRDLFERVSSWLGMRAAGWVILLVAIISAIAGAVLAWQEFRLIALLCGLLLAVALLFTIGHPKFEVQMGLDQLRVTVGDDAGGYLDVKNVAPRRNLPARVELPIGEQRAVFDLPSLAPQGAYHERFKIPTDKRGVYIIGPANSTQGDPFALTGRQTNWTGSYEFFVHPRTVPLQGRLTGFIHDLEGHVTPQLAASDMSFQSLREYAPGDDRRQVHWKTTAHLGELMVRQYEQTLQSRVAIAIDLSINSYLGEADFEEAISVAASIAQQAIREQNPLAMLTNSEVLPAVSVPRMLDEMSRLERTQSRGIMPLARFVRRVEERASVVVLVTGAATKLEDLRRACAHFELDTRVIGIIVDPQAKISVRNIANQSLAKVPNMQQLGRAMRQAMP